MDLIRGLQSRAAIMLAVIAIVLVSGTAVIKFREGEINYYNSDAVWHTLLTIEAYNETPISSHLFLPIVSLGEEGDKGIPWGATVPDKDGNYYYTSFSAAGFFLPWLFMKVFHLAVSERSLYIFNTLLFLASSILWTEFIYMIYFRRFRDGSAFVLALIGLLTYIFSPEMLHGMGIVYWHQSIMQVTLLVQVIAWYCMKETDSSGGKAVFYLMTFLNPYIEWTGYVANVGFALAECITTWKTNREQALKRAVCIGAVSAASFGLFVLHYLTRVDADILFEALSARFMARNVLTPVAMTDIFSGYFSSFLYLWVLIAITAGWNILRDKKIELQPTVLLFILLFPVVENMIMKEHAYSYTYDRMKLIFALSLLICELCCGLLTASNKRKILYMKLLSAVGAVCVLNLYSYIRNQDYVWQTDYREDNRTLAEYIRQNYDDSVLALYNLPVRGYVNLLYNRGVYEMTDMEQARSLAGSAGKRWAVMLESFGGGWNLYDLRAANVCELDSGMVTRLEVTEGTLQISQLSADTENWQLADFTDENWNKGYARTENTLLFHRQDDLLRQLAGKTKVICGNEIYYIQNMDYDDLWIRITVDKEAHGCMYPAYIRLE